jgi:hypothetical protein
LSKHQAALAEAGDQVWRLWQAVREMCDWLSGLLHQAAASGTLKFDPELQKWTGAERLYSVEHPLEWQLREPAWNAAVRISGVPDAVWNNPATGHWCVLEFKLGSAAPAIDLAQACLYHEMLKASGMGGDGALAVVSFHPQRQEVFRTGEQMQAARAALIELIGKMAGVTAAEPEPAAPSAREPAAVDPGAAAEARETGQRIVSTLAQFGVSVRLSGDAIVGPSFLRFAVMPARGVRVAQIAQRSEELQVHLKLDQAPLIHKNGGRLVIDVKRAEPQPVLFPSIEHKLPPRDMAKGSARIPLGVDLEGRLHCADISQSGCPHLLVAGTSGSGKSEWLRTAIAGLVLSNTPRTLQLILIDPKYSAFGDLEKSPFLWKNKGVIHPADHSVPDLLDELIAEMEDRNRLFKQLYCDDLAAYVHSSGKPMPRLICFCDEYFDLVADKAARREVEPRIARLGAKGRSAGIHLVLATQYPKADVVTGVIKANLSGRVCFRVTDAKQSQVILGSSGAEKLLGNGDLFFLDIGEPVRLQAPYLPKAEREFIFRA